MKKQKIIFKCEGKGFVFKDVANALKKAGIKNGDTLMVHADLARFGKLGEITDKKEFANIFIDAFLKVIGKNGTLIVPTFTYSFCNNEVYDKENTPSKAGLFTEELRIRKGAFRSLHPIFSVAAVSKRAKELTSNLSKNSFGKGSIYDRLSKIKNSKYVIFGVDYFSCTQIHYIEEKLKVPYRYVKKFKGKIKDNNKIYDDEYEYYVRRLDQDSTPSFDKIENYLFKKELLKKIQLGNAFVSVTNIGDICREAEKMFKKDQECFLEKSNMLEFEKMPFYIGMLDSPNNKNLPLTLPFALEFNKKLGLIIQKHSKESEKILKTAYKRGSSASTPLGQGSFGISRADDALKHIIKLCGKNIKNCSFLEAGCGYGYLLYQLKNLGAKNVVGCDPGTDAIEGSKKFGIKIINNFYKPELFKEKLNIIISFGLLEHVKNPLEILESFKKNIKENGKIFAAVPNCENKLRLGDISILGPEHWSFFTKETLKNVFIKSGLSNVKVVVGAKNAMIYAFGEVLSKKTGSDEISDESAVVSLFYNFSEKVKNIFPLLQKRIDNLEKQNKTLGLYGGGLQVISLLNHKLSPRFFNGDIATYGKYFPGYSNPIENPANLIKNKVDELWVMATDYDKEITDYLKKEIKIPKSTEIFSFKKYLENYDKID